MNSERKLKKKKQKIERIQVRERVKMSMHGLKHAQIENIKSKSKSTHEVAKTKTILTM